MRKQAIDELAIFGGPRQFETIISTSNLVRPDIEAFLSYSRQFFAQKQYTNNGPMVRLLRSATRRIPSSQALSHFCQRLL